MAEAFLVEENPLWPKSKIIDNEVFTPVYIMSRINAPSLNFVRLFRNTEYIMRWCVNKISGEVGLAIFVMNSSDYDIDPRSICIQFFSEKHDPSTDGKTLII